MDNVNFRSAPPQENRVFGATPSSISAPPPLPPRIQFNNPPAVSTYSSPMNNYYGYGGGGYGGVVGGGMYGTGYGGGCYGGGGFGGGGMFNSYSTGLYNSGMYGNRYGGGGMGPGDVESRFIQMAEENSRPAFQSIESFVSVIGNFATMLDSTFFALSNSFRAILGVTANLGKLRGMFGQFLSSIALFRGLHWLWRKVLYTLHLSKSEPSAVLFKEAFNAANNQNSFGEFAGQAAPGAGGRVSAWPMVAFLSFIFAAPYLIMKMVGKPDTTQLEQAKDPRTWQQPIQSQALHSFHANSPQELSVAPGEIVYVAPKEIQHSFRLMNTGWAMATKDFTHAGMVPINYLQRHMPRNTPTMAPNTNEMMNRVFDNPTPTPIAVPTVETTAAVISPENGATNSFQDNLVESSPSVQSE